MSKPKPNIIRRAEIEQARETAHHPLNPTSEIPGTHLSAMTGLERAGVSLVRIPPGKESFVYHAHYCEEEWLYIRSGRGVAEIDDVEHEVGPGDFMGFPAPSVAHHLRNPGDADLVYLMGGENRDVEIADFPKLGKRMVRRGSVADLFDIADAKGLAESDDT
jgi:uncharacterized cupin superfamily protein